MEIVEDVVALGSDQRLLNSRFFGGAILSISEIQGEAQNRE
jgi:hypothetical protein